MIAVKREVAVSRQLLTGFPWSECQVRKLTTSHCTNAEYSAGAETCEEMDTSQRIVKRFMTRTGECTVTACRT